MISIQEPREDPARGVTGSVTRSVVDGLRGPRSLTLAGFAAIIPLMIIRDVQSQLPYLTGNIFGALAAAAAGTLVTGGVLAIASVTVLRRRRTVPQAPVVTFAVFLVAASLGALVLVATNASIEMPEHQPPAASFLESMLFTTLWLTIASTMAGALEQSREASALLSAKLSQLQLTRDQSQAVLNECRAQLALTLNEATRPCAEQLRDETARVLAMKPPSRADVNELASALRSAATDVFKSTGRDLAKLETQPTPAMTQGLQLQSERPNFELRSILRRAFNRDAIAPVPVWLISLLACLLAIPRPFRFIPSLALGFVFFCGSLIIIKVLIPASVWRRPPIVRFITVSVAYWVAGATTILSPVALVFLLPDGWGPYQRGAQLGGLWPALLGASALICGWIWAIGSTMARQLQQQRRDLSATVATTQWELAQLDANVEATRHTIAHLVHTDLQGCAAGCAMLLEFALESSATPDGNEPGSSAQLGSALRQTRARLDDAIASLDEALDARPLAEHADIDSGLAAVAGTWAGFVNVDITVAPNARVCAQARPPVAVAVVELASEAIANAAIHGTARHVDVEVKMTRDELEVVVQDNGIGLGAHQTPGTGSASIDRLTSSWSLRSRDRGGCEFRAHIPVSATE